MVDIATLVAATTIRKAIRLFEWMSKDRFARVGEQPGTLVDNGSSESLWLSGDPRDAYPRTDLKILLDLGFLRSDGEQFKLTDKAERLVEDRYARKAEKPDLALSWIIVAHGEVFIDEGATPPNLRSLIGGEWNPGDRIVVTSLDPEYALAIHLPLALAESDPLFIADLNEVREDFKYADAEGNGY